MKTLRYISVLLLSLFLFNCQESPKQTYVIVDAALEEVTQHPGKKLMETYCNACHGMTATHDNRLAPPMIAVKRHYMTDDISREDFVEQIQDWIKNPAEANSRMPGAVRRFGVMPKTPYPEEAVAQIADYIFKYDPETSEWFENHFNEKRGKRRMNRP